MKRRTFALSALAVPALLGLSACGGDEGQKTGSGGTIRAGSTGQSFPNSYQEKGKLIGYDVEVLEAIAKNLGSEVKWTNADFSGLMGQLEANKLETVANAVAMTDERQDEYDFTDPYTYVGAAIVTTEDQKDIDELDDLKGKSVAGVLGSNNTEQLKTWAKKNKVDVKIRTYETRDGAMQDLLAGRVQGYVNSNGILLAEKKRTDNPLKFVGDPIAYESVGFPFKKGSKFVDTFNEQLKKLADDGTLTELSKKYFDDDLSVKPEGYHED